MRFQQLTQGLAGEGLHPSARGKRVHFSGSQRTVIEAADFGAELTPELRAQEERLRAEVEGVANRPR